MGMINIANLLLNFLCRICIRFKCYYLKTQLLDDVVISRTNTCGWPLEEISAVNLRPSSLSLSLLQE